jgi:tetratricopeptide (TPR) repeat protein
VQKALVFFEKLIVQHPDYLPTYYQMGLALEKLNQTQRAGEIYTQGIALAQITKDFKTKSELEEALSLLDD